MSLRKSGADCPYDAGGLMRRGVLALVVLLLACVLMAGAVSAEENAVTVTIGEYTRSYSTPSPRPKSHAAALLLVSTHGPTLPL